jgi:hypothetical protein
MQQEICYRPPHIESVDFEEVFTMAGNTDALIARRAYEIWEGEGRPHGRDREHWLRAEAEVSTSTSIVADPVVLKPVKGKTVATPKATAAAEAKPATAAISPKVREAVTASARTKGAPARKK